MVLSENKAKAVHHMLLHFVNNVQKVLPATNIIVNKSDELESFSPPQISILVSTLFQKNY